MEEEPTGVKAELPSKDDELFKEESSLDNGAWIKNPSNKFFLYSEGYRQAAIKLYEIGVADRFSWNTLVYPLVFCYRQYCELRLKELIIMGYKYADEAKDFKDEHDLMKLWKVYRNDVLPKVETIEQDILDNVERIILQFNTEDPNSMSYRYPVTRGPNRKESLTRKTLDIQNFKEVMDKVSRFFEWQWDMITHYSDMKADMIAEWYSEMRSNMY